MCPPTCTIGVCDLAAGECVFAGSMPQEPPGGVAGELRGESVHRMGRYAMSGKPGYSGSPTGTAPNGGAVHITRDRADRRFLSGEAGLRCGVAVRVTNSHVALGCPDSGAAGSVIVNLIGADDLTPTVVGLQGSLEPTSQFGESLTHDGSNLFIGDSAGQAVYRYDGTAVTIGWQLPLAGFGGSLDAAGGRLLVGATDTIVLFEVGSAAELDRLPLPGVVSVALSTTHAVVGLADESVHVFSLTPGLSEIQVLGPGVGVGGFGASVSLDGDRLLVGAPGTTTGGVRRGAAQLYVLEGGRFVRVARLVPDAADPEALVGTSVHLDSMGAMLGAPGHAGTTGGVFLVDL